MQTNLRSVLSTLFIVIPVFLMNACCGDNEEKKSPAIDGPNTGIAPEETPAQKTPAENPSASLPDLVITDIKINPSPTVRADGKRFLTGGQTYSFRVQVKNAGVGPIQGAVAIGVSYGFYNSGRTGDLIYASNDLQAGQSSYSQIYKVKVGFGNGGRGSIEFRVDPSNVHKESDDSPNSNARVLSFELP